MAVEVEKLLVTLEARIGKYQADLAKAQSVSNRHLGAIETRMAAFSSRLKASASTAALGVGSALGGIGAYLGVQAVVEYANAWTRLERAVDGSGQVFGIALKPAAELNKLANDARVDVEAYAKLYVRTSAAIRDYGFEAGTAEKVTSTLAKALKLGAASASEQTSVLLQFSQALQKGKLDGDEFRTVMENAGVVQELLAERLKVTKGEIVRMAADGKLQIKDLVGAMVDGAEKVDRIYRQMPMTIDEAFAVLRNNVAQFIGQADKATGASQTLASGIVRVSQNLDKIAVAAGAILASASVRMAAFAAASIAAANPLTLVAAALGALAVAYGVFGDEIGVSATNVASLKDSVSAFAQIVGAEAKAAIDAVIESTRNWAKENGVLMTTLEDLTSDPSHSLAKLAVEVYKLGDAFDGLAGKAAKAWLSMQVWSLEKLGIIDAAKKIDEIQSKVQSRATDIALERGIADGRNYGQGLQDFLKGKVTDPRSAPKPADTNAKLSQFEREVAQIKKRTAALNAEIATIDQSVLAQERAKAAAELRAAAEETARKNGRAVTAEEISAINDLASKYAEASVAAGFLKSIQERRQGIETARSEVELIGLYGEELDRARIRLDLLNEAKRLGIELSDAQRAEIDAIAASEAAMQSYKRAVDEFQSSASDALKSFVSDLREGKSATEALANSLDRLASKLIDAGLDQLVAGLTGALFGGGYTGSISPFADGGIAAQGMRRFARGGVSRSAAIFGEAGPEAAVPLPDGRRIPVDLRMPTANVAAASQAPTVVTVAPVFQVSNGTPDGIEKMKREVVPLIQQTVKDLFDRNPRFARSKI